MASDAHCVWCAPETRTRATAGRVPSTGLVTKLFPTRSAGLVGSSVEPGSIRPMTRLQDERSAVINSPSSNHSLAGSRDWSNLEQDGSKELSHLSNGILDVWCWGAVVFLILNVVLCAGSIGCPLVRVGAGGNINLCVWFYVKLLFIYWAWVIYNYARKSWILVHTKEQSLLYITHTCTFKGFLSQTTARLTKKEPMARK